MVDVSTSYMGMKLKNPIIVASSDLSRDADGVKKCADAGAGAVVLKSIFEEQFLASGNIPENRFPLHPEALDYLRAGGLLEYGPDEMCREIGKAKKEVEIPIIASVNCRTPSLWPRFANQVEEAGADALELNIYDLPLKLDISGSEHENNYTKILKEVKKEVVIPISIKLTPQVSSLPNLSKKLSQAGNDAFVFFNWFLEPDIDIDNIRTISRKGKGNFNQSLRWVALLAGRIDADISASGGVGSADDVIKQILAGASAVQICTLFYKKGLSEIQNLLQGLEAWMEKKKYNSVADFKGELSFKEQELSVKGLGEAESYFRTQYLKVFKVK
jgi:dihydroorotate dehydrogenase (fumarate)